MKTTAIILAAGKGSRMHSDIQKQYMLLSDKPVVYYSIKAFEESSVDEIILITGAGEKKYCKENIVDKYNFKKVVKIVEGGKERYNSVYNGIKAIASSNIVAIHDAARPLVDIDIIEKSINCAAKYGACVVGVPVKDTIKVVDENNTIIATPSRKTLWSAQTPQTFKYDLLKKAYETMIENEDSNITDDAMVVDKYAHTAAVFVQGSYENIKITTPEDIYVAETLIRNKSKI